MPNPIITSTTHLLPFGELSDKQFERLCLWLVEQEGYSRAEHLGEAGSDQGRDVVAYDTQNQLWYFQCKRYQTISAATLLAEVEKYNRHIATGEITKPHGIVFVTNAVLSAKARDEVGKICQSHGYSYEFWARTELDMRVKKYEAIVKEFFNLHVNPQSIIRNPQLVAISRLPDMLTNDLFGRDKELQMLNDAWANPQTSVIAFVAFGGSGKSALVNRWVQDLAKENYGGAERVYAWSFWSQGSDQPQTSADPFIDATLRWFGDADPTAGSPWDKGERLARLIKQSRTLLILDGLEPLQHPKHMMEGRLKEQSMQALLKELAAGQPGLCIISTREHVADLQGFRAPAVIAHDLEQLSPAAGASILRKQQIEDSDEELQQASNEFGNHALALTILASFLHNAYDGDVRKRKEIGPLTESLEHGGHARRVMSSYETWLRDAGEGTLLAVLRMLGLFNRPADAASLAALRTAPAIPDLTEVLLPLSEPQWKDTLAKLRRLKLLTDSSTNDEVDAHPLLREYFRDQLQRAHPSAWRAGNMCLYEHLTRTAKEFPETVEEMGKLYTAMMHGCEAGRYQEVWDSVYWRRIQRQDEYYSSYKLGMFSAELAALSSFIDLSSNKIKSELIVQSAALAMREMGYCLRALGHLQDADAWLRAAQNAHVSERNWIEAAIDAGLLSQLHLIAGNLRLAISHAEQGVHWADMSEDKFRGVISRTVLGDALHEAGDIGLAEKAFCDAENIQRIWNPNYQYLYTGNGIRYCKLLLGQNRYREVIERLPIPPKAPAAHVSVFSAALEHLCRGVAYILEAKQTGRSFSSKVESFLLQAVDGTRGAGQAHHLSWGLLTRAAFYREERKFNRAASDLAEALTIAERGEMRLHLCDYHLESARLHLAQGHTSEAHAHWETARHMVNEMGYHRRDGEVAGLEAQLTALG